MEEVPVRVAVRLALLLAVYSIVRFFRTLAHWLIERFLDHPVQLGDRPDHLATDPSSLTVQDKGLHCGQKCVAVYSP